MNEVGLSYKGRQLYLDPDFQIDWEVQDDLFDFDRMGEGSSWQIQIPIKGNEWVFGFASDPANADNKFTTYDGFAITMGGNVWWEVSCELLRVSDDGRFYECVLSTINNDVYDSRTKSIKDIITYEITNPGNGSNDAQLYNQMSLGPVYFPILHFYGDNSLSYSELLHRLVNTGDNGIYLPCFRVFFLLEKSFEALGYTLHINCVIPSDVKKAILFDEYLPISNMFGGTTLDVAEYCLDITLTKLLKLVTFLTGAGLFINQDEKIADLRNIKFDTQKSPIDISDKVGPLIIPEKPEYFDFKIEYELDKDELLSEVAEDYTAANYQGEFDDLQDFIDNSTNTLGFWGFCKLENAYYAWVTAVGVDGGKWILQIGHPFEAIQSGTTSLTTITSPALPCAMDKYQYVVIEGPFKTEEYGTSRLRIKDVDISGLLSLTSEYKYTFIEEGAQWYDIEQYYLNIAAYDFTNDTFDTFLDYIDEEVIISRIILRRDSDYYHPILGSEPKYGISKSGTPRLLLWHGLKGSGSDWPFASPSPYYLSSGSAVKGLNFSLNTSGDNNVWLEIWTFIVSVIKEAKVIKMYGYLSTSEISKLIKTRKLGRNQKGLFRFKSFRALLTRRGIRNQEIEGYGL